MHPALLQHWLNPFSDYAQAHFTRTNLSGDLAGDQARVLVTATRLLQACVDVITSSSWLNPAIAAMEMSQMVIQAMCDAVAHRAKHSVQAASTMTEFVLPWLYRPEQETQGAVKPAKKSSGKTTAKTIAKTIARTRTA